MHRQRRTPPGGWVQRDISTAQISRELGASALFVNSGLHPGCDLVHARRIAPGSAVVRQ